MKQPNFWRSLQHAWSGLVLTVRTQRNAKIHVAAGFATMALGCWLHVGVTQLSILALTIGAVIFAETLNTAIESLVDLISPDWHQQAKVTKDAAAGAVLAVSLAAVLVGLLILGPPLWAFLVARIKVT